MDFFLLISITQKDLICISRLRLQKFFKRILMVNIVYIDNSGRIFHANDSDQYSSYTINCDKKLF